MLFRWVLWLGVAMIISLDGAMAERIYQWVDSAGVRHFTNNELNIPSQYRVKIKDMKALTTGAGKQKTPAGNVSGKELWLERCASCHTMNAHGDSGIRSLASVVIDPATRFPRSEDVLSGILRGAVEGRTTDMKRVEIRDSELLEIARYLIEYSKNN